MEQAEEQKVIEAKIRMRNQEQQDDEERKQRREEDIRAGRIRVQPPRVQPITNHQIVSAPIDEIDGLNWRSGWGSADRQSQALTTSAPLERLDPFSLWVDEEYQRTDAAAPSQQIAASVVSNTSSPINQQQIEIGFPIPQAPPGATRGRHREEEFDIDLEDIMVMEAIWLSIQEQEVRRRSSEGEATRSRPAELLAEISLGSLADDDSVLAPPPPPEGVEGEPWDQRQGLAAGGLAGAIAALAERQAVGGDTTAQNLPPPHPEGSRLTQVSNVNEDALESTNTGIESERQSGSSQRGDLHFLAEIMPSVSGRGEEDAENSSRASEKLANWVSSTQKEYKGSSTWLGDQSSEQVEVGTSFSSSVPSASELPWEAPDNGESSGANNDKVLVPDSFEEQMMLAMALSLADAQAQVHQGGNRSGPLPLSTNPEAQARVQRQGTSRSGPLPRPTYSGH